MAKRRRSAPSASDFSTTLRRAATSLDAWKDERGAIANTLREVIASAGRMLAELGLGAGAPGAGDVTRRKGGRPKGYKMSAETRRKLREAWKRRKAAAAKADKT